ncbi:MAG: alpha/beta hydrolase [Flavobacteriales bacterium]|nr:alpha/beta hydrolase [Flavobacteriales bacterium]
MIFSKKEVSYNYIEEGSGHPVVLLHGLMGGLSNFNELKDFLVNNNYKVYIPQLPIYSLPVLSTNVNGIAKFVAKFMKDVVKKPSTFLGNSLGGHVGLVLSLKYPNWVHSLVLTGSSGLYEKSFGETFPKRGNYEYIKKKTEEVFYRPETATKELVDEVFAVVNDRIKAIKTVTLARNAIRHNLSKELPNIKCPVLLIWGKQDNVTPPSVAEEFHELIPNTELKWINECGHAPMMEKPDEFNSLLLPWLNEITNGN